NPGRVPTRAGGSGLRHQEPVVAVQKIGVLELGAQPCGGGDVAETGEAEPDVDAALMVERTRSDGQSFVDGGGSTQAAPCVNPVLVKAEGGVVGGLVGPPDIATILSAVLGG